MSIPVGRQRQLAQAGRDLTGAPERALPGRIPEFGSRVLEVMRQPMEEKQVTLSRAQGSPTFPSNFQLVAP